MMDRKMLRLLTVVAAGTAIGTARAHAPASGPTSNSFTARPPHVVEVEIKEFTFQADTTRVTPGTTVRWINRDQVAHTSTAENGEWESPLLGPGETFTAEFGEQGIYPYYCTPHPFMRGLIIVEGSRAAVF